MACESCMVASSIASVVVLDPEKGTATKVYVPPPLVRILYWVAFQAKFPYETNTAALASGRYRRQIASLLTTHRFGKDLVAPVTSIDCTHGNCSFVHRVYPRRTGQERRAGPEIPGRGDRLLRRGRPVRLASEPTQPPRAHQPDTYTRGRLQDHRSGVGCDQPVSSGGSFGLL